MFAGILNVRGSIHLLFYTLFFSFNLYSQSQKLIISEIMAINDTTLTDEDSDFPDWIEIYNPDNESINLGGWFLSDDSTLLTKWCFPSILLGAGEYIFVYASDKNRMSLPGNLHTNFKLSGSGEFLALTEPDGITISSFFGNEFPVQKQDVSYGLINGQYVYLKNPTPGGENTTGGYMAEPRFSHERGFYSFPFDVELNTIDSNCYIYYTLDGSQPGYENGILYTTAVPINNTTVFSAVVIEKTTLKSSDIVSHTYLFIDDIMTQPNDPEGYPSVWGQDYQADYEMDPEICTPDRKAEMEEALKSLPTVSLVTDIDHLFSHSEDPDSGGLYIYTLMTTDEWERPVSMEYFDSLQNESFQINCGLRLHGGNGRKPGNTPKHSLRVSFRSEYGPSKLNFNLFKENSATNEFNALVLRAGYNYSWGKNSPEQCEGSDYIRDPFAKKTQLDMDRTAAHTKFVHLYLNGLYWGVYNISEKITDDFAEEYLGGNEEEYDVVKDHYGITDGNRDAWNSLMAFDSESFISNVDYMRIQGRNEDGTVNISYQNLLDVRNLSDYMLINFYIGNIDWDKNNWLAVRNRVKNEHGFKFFCWDAENAMNDINENIVDINNQDNPSSLFTQLRKNPEFQLYFADRIHKHFFNGGALTASETRTRYTNFAQVIDKAMLAESARWGDYRRDVDPGDKTYYLYTRDEHWLNRVEYMQSIYLPRRSAIVLDQLKEEGLYPDIEAPVFSQHGGEFDSLVDLTITADAEEIYFTMDDSDPREIGGGVSLDRAILYSGHFTLAEDAIIKARAKDGDEWSALTRARFRFTTSSHDTTISVSICQGENYNGISCSGNYFLTQTSSSGTDSIIKLQLTVHQLPQVKLGQDTTIMQADTLILESKAEYASYLWNTYETSGSIRIIGTDQGKYEYWLSVIDENGCQNADTICVTVNKLSYIIDESYAEKIKVYPNPTTDYINIEFANGNRSKVYVEIYSPNGILIFIETVSFEHTHKLINLDHLSEGIYLMKIRTENSEKVFKIVKD